MFTKQPIGIFDSGVGGTSIWKEIVRLLPSENTIYLADSKHAPYGNKSKKEIIALSIKNTEKLLEKNAKLVVVACNTATTNAIKILRETYPVPFIGIEPAIKPAALQSKTKKIGILATKGTLSSELFAQTSSLYAKGIQTIEIVGEGLVELIETGNLHSKKLETLLLSYVQPMIQKDIDYLVLGCSHYPYLIPLLQKMLPMHVKIIDSGLAVARQTKSILAEKQLLQQSAENGRHLLYSNDSLSALQRILSSATQSHTAEFMDF